MCGRRHNNECCALLCASGFMGVSGLALAASLSAFIWSVFGLLRIMKKTGKLENIQLPQVITMGICFAAVMLAVRMLMLKFVGNGGFLHSAITLAVSGGAALAVYALAAYVFKINEVMNFLKRRGNVD